MKSIILSLVIAFGLIACSKDQSATEPVTQTPLNMLQKRWIIDSVMIYADSNVYGDYLFAFAPPVTQYEDFRTDGRVYSYGGDPVIYYDTAVYQLLPDNVTLLAYPIEDGVVSPVADTGTIITLTENALMYRNKNSVGEHGRWVLKR